MTTILMPGDWVTADQIPATHDNKMLVLGPGLKLVPPSTVTAVRAGEFCKDERRNMIWIESVGGRYISHIGDLVIATVHHSSADTYHCSLTPHTPSALLGQLSFEGATKKTRPILNPGMLVYARVKTADKWADVELECCDQNTGKSDGMGPLKEGMTFNVTLDFARRLVKPEHESDLVLLDEIGAMVRFEVAIGRNGVVWVSADRVKETIAIGRALQDTDQQGLSPVHQKKLVKALLKDV